MPCQKIFFPYIVSTWNPSSKSEPRKIFFHIYIYIYIPKLFSTNQNFLILLGNDNSRKFSVEYLEVESSLEPKIPFSLYIYIRYIHIYKRNWPKIIIILFVALIIYILSLESIIYFISCFC